MQSSVSPGYLHPLLRIVNRGKFFFSALILPLLLIVGFQNSVSASPMPPGVPDLTHPNTRLTILVDYSIADNTANNIIRAHIVDSDGNPVPNTNVNFRWNPGTGEVTIGVMTDASGNADLSLASAIIGQVAVNARVNGVLLENNNPITVTYVAYVPDPTVSTTRLEVVTTGQLADGTSNNRVKAVVTDVNGNPVPNQSVTFQMASGIANFTSPVTVVTNASGEAFITLSSSTVGSVSLTADVVGIPITNNSPATVQFVADVPNVAVPTTFIEVVTTNALSNGTATNSVRAHVSDQYGNSVANATVTFAIASGTATPSGPLTVTTDANGYAVLVLTSTVANTVSITAQVNGTPITNGSPASVVFVVDAPSVSVSTTRLEVVTTGAIADGTATNSVRAVITDANGNPAPNQTIIFNIASGTGTFTTPVTVTTDANGVAVVALVSTTTGNVGITATVNGTPLVNGSPATVVFVADAPDVTSPTTFIEVVTTGAVANGTATNSVRAHITDVNGNPVAGQTVTFVIASGTATPSGSLTVITDANGNAVIALTSTVPNSVNITASVNGNPITNGSPAAVVFVVDVPSVSVSTTLIEVVNTNAVANDVALNTVRAIITDANGNRVPGQTVKFTIASGSATFVGSDELITDINGEVIINLQSTVAGEVSITATVNTISIINGSPAIVVFVAGDPDLSHPATAIVVVDGEADADGVDKAVVKAHIVDAFGNPVPNQTITFTIGSGTASPSGPLTLTTDENGDAVLEMTSSTIGDVTITATVNTLDIPNGSPATVSFVPYADVTNPQTQLVVDIDNAAANGVSVNVIRAHVIDNTGNVMAGAEVVFTIASGEATIITPQPVITDVNGDAIIQLTSTKAGYVTVTATVDNKPIVFGSPARVRFTVEDVWVPRVFTPNGDGTNDIIRPIINGNFQFEYFNIYNRWGNLLFTSKDRSQGWDGRFKGVLQPNETYMWIIGGRDVNNVRQQKRGMFSLVR